MTAERVNFMREKKQQEYQNLLKKQSDDYREFNRKVTQAALSFLNITEQDYSKSYQELTAENITKGEYGKLMEKIDYDIRDKHELRHPIKSKDEVKKIYLELLQMESHSIKT